MTFFIANPDLDKQIAEIRRKIRLSMNGVVSEKMIEGGIVYKQNYGVAIPRLREIAKQYAKNHDLAQRLWNLKIRETMILATLLEPEEKFSTQNAFNWLLDFNQIELIEQACMNLFCKLPYANTLCIELIKSDNFWEQTTGFILSARIYLSLNNDEAKQIVSAGISKSATENLHLYKAIATSFSRLVRKDGETAALVIKKIESLSQSNLTGQKYIFHEVKEEISFLNFL